MISTRAPNSKFSREKKRLLLTLFEPGFEVGVASFLGWVRDFVPPAAGYLTLHTHPLTQPPFIFPQPMGDRGLEPFESPEPGARWRRTGSSFVLHFMVHVAKNAKVREFVLSAYRDRLTMVDLKVTSAITAGIGAGSLGFKHRLVLEKTRKLSPNTILIYSFRNE